MENRYVDILEKYNQDIINLCPGNFTSHLILALELQKIERTHSQVLEIGCGSGDSTLPVLENTKLQLDVLDVSEDMIRNCQEKLFSYRQRINYICQDALLYLADCKVYDAIFSEWVVHNFIWNDKQKLFNQIYMKLKSGGYFLLMDKILPDSGFEQLLAYQLRRYNYLIPVVRDKIIEHELQDHTPDFRMDESMTIMALYEVGFSEVVLVDRLERDVVLIAKK